MFLKSFFTFSAFKDNGSECGSFESQFIGNSFVTLSSLINVNDFLPHVFLNIFKSWCDVLLC